MSRPYDYITFFCTVGFVVVRPGSLAIWSVSNASLVLLRSYRRGFAWGGFECHQCRRLLRPQVDAQPVGAARLCTLFLLVYLAAPFSVRVEPRRAEHYGWTIFQGAIEHKMNTKRSNQSLEPTQHFVVSSQSMRRLIFKVLGGLSLSR